jgi:phosphatidate phosphatase APP1
MDATKKPLKEWLLNKLHITRLPVVKVYNGYGDDDMLLVMGHVLKQSPLPKTKFKKSFLSNSLSLIRLFIVEPYKNIRVQLLWGEEQLEGVTDENGFFKFEWTSKKDLEYGWHETTVRIAEGKHTGTAGKGKLLVPHPTQHAFISDIDDTFLVSHSSRLGKRLYVLLTKNARTRRPFEGVVRHYQLLANSSKENEPNPFFYVSSSEWNLYDYIQEFKKQYHIPEGVYLLNKIKVGLEFLQTGQGKHDGKYIRIVRILKEFPARKFVLLGDDTQRDPDIYTNIVEKFPGRVICVYIRHVNKKNKAATRQKIDHIKNAGVEALYFEKSEEAIHHSRSIGLIQADAVRSF